MFTSLTEINPASEYQNLPSRSFVFNESSINDGQYFVSGILGGEELILLNSNSEGIEQITSALPKFASIFGEIDKVCTISSRSSNYLEPCNSQLPKWHSSLSDKSGLGLCYADRDTDTLDNGGGRDRLFARE